MAAERAYRTVMPFGRCVMLLGDPVTRTSGVWQRIAGGQIFVVSAEPTWRDDPVPARCPLPVRASSTFFLGPDWLAIAASMEGSGSVINVVL